MAALPIQPPELAKASESKKEEFRKYLEKSGVLDAITKVLVALYEEPEKPTNALEFVKQYLGAPTQMEVEVLKTQNEELMKKKDELSSQINELTLQVNQLRELNNAGQKDDDDA
eukprot:gnl/Hemi2/6527_TR2225_c0_g1_i2.p1 gnl/Hemi2/6527_TR2225_c0_g1~~gnl/Hemi2/6527_TR2225_c0_g1_i2.p1  ORF type:complete len:114 (-),score=38.98 gnl/Hemi2/6527_TR2225_c0_g1_i2:157-498(-)